MRIAIQGAGIAGTTLAYWLLQGGHEPVLIEEAPRLRTGGYVIDFWGLGLTVAERMSLVPQILGEGYAQRELRFLDNRSRVTGGFSMEIMREVVGRFTTIRRSTLAQIIFDALENRVETIFGDTIVALEERGDCIRAILRNGGERDLDLVIGADGQHSGVRSLCFGSDEECEAFLGYAVAAFEVEGYRPRDEGVYVVHPTASHQIARVALRQDRTLFLLVFRTEASVADARLSISDIRSLLRSEFGNAGWEAREVLAAMTGVDDIYFDRMSQIRLPSWHRGRVALVGDAAAAVSLLAGEGTGLAMAEAYVLAGELHWGRGDCGRALSEYERRLFAFLKGKQASAENFASSFVPKTEFGIWVRNQATKLMSIPGIGSLILRESLRDDLELPNYFARA